MELEEGTATLIEIEYQMQDGSVHGREYLILIDSEAGDIARMFFSRIGAIFHGYYHDYYGVDIYTPEDLLDLLDTPLGISMTGAELAKEQLTKENAEALLRAIIADSEEGNLVPHAAFHPDPVLVDAEYSIEYWSHTLSIRFPDCEIYLDIYSDSRHTLAWLEEMGMAEQFHEYLIEKIAG